MNWLTDLRNCVLDASNDKKAAKSLHGGRGNPGAALIDRAKFLRDCWKDCSEDIEDLKIAACNHAANQVARELDIPTETVAATLQDAIKGNELTGVFSPDEKRTHHTFVYHGLRHLESITHYNPWSEATARAGRILSNMADTPFIFCGRSFASAESFLQSMRISPKSVSPSRADVARMAGPDAQDHGRMAKKRSQESLRMDDAIWLWGQEQSQPVERRSPAFEKVMTEALIAKVRSNDLAAKALSACSDLPVVHYVRRRGRYKIEQSSHLPRCLPATLASLRIELPVLTVAEIGHWLQPSSN